MSLLTLSNNFENVLKPALRRFTRDNETVIVRAINETTKKGIGKLVRLISDQTGIKLSSVRSRVKFTKRANKADKTVIITIYGTRTSLQDARVLTKGTVKSGAKRKVGISFKGDGSKREKLLEPIAGGSKAFLFKSPHSKKKIAGYRPHGFKRKVRKLAWHSIPFEARKIYQEFLRDFLVDNIQKEYVNQLERVRYLKKRRGK